MFTYYIIFPSADRSKIKVLELSKDLDYQLDDYDVASRKKFPARDSAEDYAKSLAKTHGKEYVGFRPEPDKHDYLD